MFLHKKCGKEVVARSETNSYFKIEMLDLEKEVIYTFDPHDSNVDSCVLFCPTCCEVVAMKDVL